MVDDRCIKCGYATQPSQRFCSNCGAPLKGIASQNEPSIIVPSNATAVAPAARPLGVTIIALMEGIGGFLLILMGGILASGMLELPYDFVFELPIFSGILVDVDTMSAIFFIFGLMGLLISYGFWTGKSFSRLLFLAMNVLSMLSVSTIIVNAAMIIYMFRPGVKQYFAGSQGAPPVMPLKHPQPKPPETYPGSKQTTGIGDGSRATSVTIGGENQTGQPSPPPSRERNKPVLDNVGGRGEAPSNTPQSRPIATDAIRQEYESLRRSLGTSELSEEDFLARIQAMRFRDSSGRLWTLGRDSGAWYTFDGKRWVPGNPPDTLSRGT